MLQKFNQLLFVLLCVLPLNLSAKKEASQVDQIQTRYQSIRSFHGNFIQTIHFSDPKIPARKATGTVAYQRPGQMRWNYDKPNEQLLVTDGVTIWLFDPLLENVTIQELKKITQGTPLSFLLGIGNLNTDFKQRPLSKVLINDAEIMMVELEPRSPIANIAYIQLGVYPQSFNLKILILMDHQGNYRAIELQKMQYNIQHQKNLFTFEVTPTMEVIKAPSSE